VAYGEHFSRNCDYGSHSEEQQFISSGVVLGSTITHEQCKAGSRGLVWVCIWWHKVRAGAVVAQGKRHTVGMRNGTYTASLASCLSVSKEGSNCSDCRYVACDLRDPCDMHAGIPGVRFKYIHH
jgi:hypothetical protein